jgi:hypothetical protein
MLYDVSKARYAFQRGLLHLACVDNWIAMSLYNIQDDTLSSGFA